MSSAACKRGVNCGDCEMTDLKVLIAAVEDGSVTRQDLIETGLGEVLTEDFVTAFEGSLDAAASLHGALLPGWGWLRQGPANIVSTDINQWEDSQYGYGDSAIPARAWLLAILRALDQRR